MNFHTKTDEMARYFDEALGGGSDFDDKGPPACNLCAAASVYSLAGPRRRPGRPTESGQPSGPRLGALRSRTGRMKPSGCGRPTGIGHRNKQQDGAHGQENLACRPEHEVTEPEQRDDHARARGDRVDNADVHGEHHDKHRQGVPGIPAGEHHATAWTDGQ